MNDRTIAYIALVVALVALAWAVVHSFIRDSANGGMAHTRGIGNADVPGMAPPMPSPPPTLDNLPTVPAGTSLVAPPPTWRPLSSPAAAYSVVG